MKSKTSKKMVVSDCIAKKKNNKVSLRMSLFHKKSLNNKKPLLKMKKIKKYIPKSTIALSKYLIQSDSVI